MLEVTCFHCGQVVQISPDAERCSVCGMNLRKLIGREQASSYFYQRAAEMAASGNVVGAMQEVQRGLAYVNSSELNLLGAILSKRLGHIEDMRHYVAAIPVDDPLRGEGEWLLRSNQARTRAPEPVQKGKPGNGKAPVAIEVIPDSDALPTMVEEITPTRTPRPANQPSPWRALMWMALVVLLLGGGWYAMRNLGRPTGSTGAGSQAGSPAQTASQPAGQSAAAAATPGPSAADATGSAAATPEPANPAGGATRAPATPPSLFPTPTIANDLVQTEAVSQALASANPGQAVDATELTKLNWPAFLRSKNRPELADLPVTLRVQGKSLIFEGTCELAEQRAALAFMAKQVPGVQDVSVVNVKLRPPATYKVREGDTLWDISVRIYGDPTHIDQLFAANRDKLPSASALAVGMELAVPK